MGEVQGRQIIIDSPTANATVAPTNFTVSGHVSGVMQANSTVTCTLSYPGTTTPDVQKSGIAIDQNLNWSVNLGNVPPTAPNNQAKVLAALISAGKSVAEAFVFVTIQ